MHPLDAALHRDLGLPGTVHLHHVTESSGDPVQRFASRLPQSLMTAHPRRQRDFLLGRHCAAVALSRAGHVGPTWLPVGPDKLPVWPEGWMGSISHAGTGAVAVVTADTSIGSLGVDMEQWIGEGVLRDVRPLVADALELGLLAAMGDRRGFTVLFSAKEALYKALYPHVREFFDFSAARLISASDNELQLRLAVRWGDGFPAGTVIPVSYALRDECAFTVLCHA